MGFNSGFKGLKTRSIRFNLVTAPSLLALLYVGNVQFWAFPGAVSYLACIVISCSMSSINIITPSSDKHDKSFGQRPCQTLIGVPVLLLICIYLRILLFLILDTMMSPPTLSPHKLRIWTAGFLFILMTLENRTDSLYRNVGKELPLLAA